MSLNTQKNTKVSKNNEDSDAGEFDLFSWCRDPAQDALYDDKINSQNSSDELPNAEMEQLEKTAYYEVLTSMIKYNEYTVDSVLNRRARYISGLPQKHRNLLLNIGLNEKFKTIHRCIERNSLFFLKVAHANRMMFDKDLFSSKEDKATESGERDNNAEVPSKQEIYNFINLVSEEVEEPFDPRYMDKLSSALKILVRDWSEEGSEERAATYGIILGVLKDIFCDVPKEKLNSIDILVPGAGLGRLAFEIANLGFNCEGNENDYLMLMISNFILNYTQQERQCTIYPYIHSFSNILNSGDMFRQINVPEILPSTLLMRSTSNFSMAAGDFVQSYKHGEQNKWDAVVTCFFLDTARNPIEYLETILGILKPGGLWINLGPLLWHTEGNTKSKTLELAFNEIILLASEVGFIIDHDKINTGINLSYANDPKSMLNYTYTSPLTIAFKQI